jgi:hypothetical protein
VTTTNDVRTTSPAAARARPSLARPAEVGVRGRRRPWLLGAGVALAVIGALAAFWLVGAAGDRVPVLAVARNVPFGEPLTEADLRIVEVAADAEVATVPADRLDDVLGRVAAAPLAPGALLTQDVLAVAGPPGVGELLIGVAVPAGRMPAGRLAVGESVLIVETPPNEAEVTVAPPRTFPVTLVRIGEPDVNGVSVLDVAVADDVGPALAALAATGRIAVAVEPRGSTR